MCGGSSKQTTNSTSTYTPNAAVGSAATGAIQNAQELAQTPFNYDTTRNVAGFNPQQTAAFNQIAALQGVYAPYLDASSQYTGAAASPISGSQIQNYMNPYQQQVVDATLANIGKNNAVQQNQLKGNAISQGALGGNRVGVAQAELARNQDLNTNQTIANLMSQGYGQALGAAQQDAGRQMQAGQQFAGLGQLAQGLGLQGAQALLGAGNQQQAQLQNVYDAASGNYQAATMWPYQNQQWSAGILGALGPLLGGTTTGNSTTTAKQGMGLGQIIGLGTAILGGLKDGGSVGYADGGSAFGQMPDGGFFPWSQLQASRPVMPELPSAPSMPQQNDSVDIDASLSTGKRARQGIDKILKELDPAKGWGASIVPTSSLGTGASVGGKGMSGLGSLFGFADGGDVPSLPAPPKLSGSSFVPSPGSVPGASPDSYYATALANLARSRGEGRSTSLPEQIIAPPSGGNGFPVTNGGKGSLFRGLFGSSGPSNFGKGSIPTSITSLGFADGGSIFDALFDPEYNATVLGSTPEEPEMPKPAGDNSVLKSGFAPNDPRLVDQNIGQIGSMPEVATAPTKAAPEAPKASYDPFSLIRREEGFAPVAKWDVRQHSGGYGSKAAPGETFTREKAEQYLRRDAAPAMKWVDTFAPNATPSQKAALVSFGYNLGVDDLDRLKGDIQSGNWERVAGRMKSFNKALNSKTGQLEPLAGLTNRRNREASLIMGGDIGNLPEVSYPSPSGGEAPKAIGLVEKGMSQDVEQKGAYKNAADRASGGLLKRLFGVEFNPLRLDKDERMALVTAGLGMMVNGNIGQGGLAGIQYLQSAEERRAKAAQAAQELQLELMKINRPTDAVRNYEYAQAQTKGSGGSGVTFDQWQADAKKREFAPPDSVREYEYAKNQGFAGSLQDFQQWKSGNKPLSSTDKKAILEADDAVLATRAAIENLDNAITQNVKAYSGPLAKERGYAGSILGLEGGEATRDIDNLIGTQAVGQLKAIFGGMPTEGERKILMELQGSVNESPKVREGIWKRAKALAENRLRLNERQAEEIRGGTYFKPGGKGDAAASPKSSQVLNDARSAIARGASKEAVIKRLQENGFSAEGL